MRLKRNNSAPVVKVAKPRKKGGKKGRKYGRNKEWCKRYLARGIRERNKIKRLRKHLKYIKGCDTVAENCLRELRGNV